MPCGSFSSGETPPRYAMSDDDATAVMLDPKCLPHRMGTLSPPLSADGTVGPHVVFVYDSPASLSSLVSNEPASLCVGQLIALYGQLAPTQPVFKHFAACIMQAVCDIDVMCSQELLAVCCFLLLFSLEVDCHIMACGQLLCWPIELAVDF